MKGTLARLCVCSLVWLLISEVAPAWAKGKSLYEVSTDDLEARGSALIRRGRALGQGGAVIGGLPVQQGWLRIDKKITRLGKEVKPGRHSISFTPMSYPSLPTPPERYKRSMKTLGRRTEDVTFSFDIDAQVGHIYEIMTVFPRGVQCFGSFQEVQDSSDGIIHEGYFSEKIQTFEVSSQYVESYIIDRTTLRRVAGETMLWHRMVIGPEPFERAASCPAEKQQIVALVTKPNWLLFEADDEAKTCGDTVRIGSALSLPGAAFEFKSYDSASPLTIQWCPGDRILWLKGNGEILNLKSRERVVLPLPKSETGTLESSPNPGLQRTETAYCAVPPLRP